MSVRGGVHLAVSRFCLNSCLIFFFFCFFFFFFFFADGGLLLCRRDAPQGAAV
jgi:hypothetical protein